VIKCRLTFRDIFSDLIIDDAIAVADLSGVRRKVEGKLRPRNIEDVVRIVRAARKHKIKLHAFSCGRNWGFGSQLPAFDDAWLVDLGGMTQVTEYDSECGVVRIEPGVTQGDLYRTLADHGNEWFFNITGAGESTSVLGNALERGIGYYGQRHLDLVELQVVTGSGDVVWTRLAQPGSGPSGAPLGTDITQLFCQGSLGIVVAARLRLIRRTNGGGVIIARLKAEMQADTFFRRILSLKQEGCIAGVPHMGNRERIISTMVPWIPANQVEAFSERAPAWTAALPLLGRRELVDAAARVIETNLADLCHIETFLGTANLDVDKPNPSPREQLQLLACGFPSNLALPGVQWSALGRADVSVLDPEKTSAGLIHVTPAIRSSASEIQCIVTLVGDAGQSLNLPPLAMTVNIVDSLTTVVVISVPFPQRDAKHSQEKARALAKLLRNAGIGFYRLGLIRDDGAPLAKRPARRIHAELKRNFDPYNVFAPSKYDSLFATPPRVSVASHSQRSGIALSSYIT